MTTVDAVGFVRRLVKDELGVRVPDEIPDPRPDEFVYVCRSAGGWIDQIRDAPRVDVHCWAETYERAEELSDMVSELMKALNRSVSSGFLTCTEITRRRDPDPDSHQPRWYASYLLNTFSYRTGGNHA